MDEIKKEKIITVYLNKLCGIKRWTLPDFLDERFNTNRP
jgi:hypothetical protein